jgi:hypothetical protein
MQETSLLSLSTEPITAVEKLMEYLYTSTYTSVFQSPDFSIHLHIVVYALAHKYALEPLLTLARSNFITSLYHVKDLTHYFSAVEEVYKSTPGEARGLRDVVVETAAMEMEAMLAVEMAKDRMIGCMGKVPAYGSDVLASLLLLQQSRKRTD